VTQLLRHAAAAPRLRLQRAVPRDVDAEDTDSADGGGGDAADAFNVQLPGDGRGCVDGGHRLSGGGPPD
jgi:hypothetical protein